MNNIQISELLETLDIQDNSVFPVVFQGNTKKISFKTLKEAIINKSVTGFKIEVVEELPPRGDKYTIYFAKNIDNEYYSEFLFYNNEWIKVGDTALQKDADILYKQGTNIFVNTAEMLINLGIDGYYKQEKRDGYNVLNNELTSQEINGIRVVVNEDGSVLLNGQSTQRTILTLKENIKLEDGKPYRLSGAPLNSNETNYYLQINQEYNDTDHKATDYGTGMNFTYTEDSENSNSIYIVIENDVELNNVIFKPMVSIGTDSRLFEKYGKTPSLDYPSEMNFATGTKEINISNKKNLYNRNSIDVENAYLTKDNKVINAVDWYITDFIEIEENQFYILNNVIGDIQSACIYDNNKNLIGNLDNYNNRSQITFEAPIHSKYIKLSVNTNIDILELYLQQEFSMQNNSQTYEVHLEDLVLKGNENVRDTFIENDFTFYEVESIGYKEFDGTEEWELIEVGDKTLFAISIEDIKALEEPMLNGLLSNMFTETIYSELAEYSEAEMLQTLDNKVIFYTSKIDTLEDWQEYLSNNILQLAYPLETPIVKEITNKTLIKDLTKIKNQAKSYKNRTYVDSDKTIYFDLAYTTGNQDVGNMIADRTIDNAVKVARIQEILPTKANEVETANKLQMTVDNTTYVLTVKLLNKDNEIISEKEVDLPIEAMVVGGEYDPETKEVVLTLQSGQEVRFSVADLVSGLASQQYVDTELEKKVDKVEGKDLISNVDKTKLDGIEENANNYTLPTASSDTKGGIQVGYIQNEKKYPVQLDENGNAYVNVPWEGNELVAQEVVDARGEFDTLGNRLDNVDQNIIISTKPFETNYDIEDSANSKIKFNKIIGGLLQDTREGYNLNAMADNSGGVISSMNWAIKDSQFILNGTATKSNPIPQSSVKLGTFEAGTYSVLVYHNQGSIVNPVGTGFYINTDTSMSSTTRVTNVFLKQESVIQKFTLTQTETLYGYIFMDNRTSYSNFQVGIMIAKGELTEKPKWEQYGAMPSINYPSELKYVGGNYDIDVSNKNLLDISKGTSTSTSYYLDNKVIINGGTYSNFLCPTIVITETDFYVFSFTAKVTSGNINFSILKNGTQIADTSVTENKNYSYKFSFSKGDNVLIRLRSVNNGVGEFSQIQLEQGSTATDYIEHQEQIYPLDLSNRNLLNPSSLAQGEWNNTTTTTRLVYKLGAISKGEELSIIRYNNNYRFAIIISNSPTQSSNASALSSSGFITNNAYTFKASVSGYLYIQFTYLEEKAISISDINNKEFMLVKGSNVNLSYVPYTSPYNYSLYSDKDYIYKKDNKWYVHNEWNRIVLDGTINKFDYKMNINNNNQYLIPAIDNILKPQSNSNEVKLYSNYFNSNSSNNIYLNNIEGIAINIEGRINIGFGLDSGINTLELANDKLQELYNAGTPVEIIYPLATPTETEIQGENEVVEAELLYTQLEALYNMKTYKGGTHITFDEIGKIQGEYIIDNGLAEAVREFNEINGYVDEARVIELINKYK